MSYKRGILDCYIFLQLSQCTLLTANTRYIVPTNNCSTSGLIDRAASTLSG